MSWSHKFEPWDAGIPDLWKPWWTSFTLALRAENKSEQTVQTYGQSFKQLALSAPGTTPLTVTRDQVRAFMEDLIARQASATANNRFNGLRAFFNWLVAEGELSASPMAHMSAPAVLETPPPILEEDELRRLVAACAPRRDPETTPWVTLFRDRRDAAIIRFLIDSGSRRGEVCSMTVANTHVDKGEALVRGKGQGQKERIAAFGAKTARDIDRYLRFRGQHRDAGRPELWLGLREPLDGSGVKQIIKRRAADAGLERERVYVHLFRHTFGHTWRANGGTEADLMELAGWTSVAMARRYGKSAAGSRARAAHKLLSPGDRI